MNRSQFTFYRSYYEAIKKLPKKEQGPALMGVCAYALYEEEPELRGVAEAVFTLIRPTLDSGRRKAQCGGKREAKPKQKGNEEKEKVKGEVKGEADSDDENECLLTPIPPAGDFEDFWKAYPRKAGKDAARRAFSRAGAEICVLLDALERQKQTEQWRRENGRFIPYPATWLNQGRWQDETPAEPSANRFLNLLREGAFDE